MTLKQAADRPREVVDPSLPVHLVKHALLLCPGVAQFVEGEIRLVDGVRLEVRIVLRIVCSKWRFWIMLLKGYFIFSRS